MAPLVMLSPPIFLKPGVEQIISSCADVDVLIANAGDICSRNRIATSPEIAGDLPHGAGVVRLCEGVVWHGYPQVGTVVIVSSIAAFTPMKSVLMQPRKRFRPPTEKSLSRGRRSRRRCCSGVPGLCTHQSSRSCRASHLEQKVPDSCGAALKMSSKLSERCVAIASCVYRRGPTV